MLRIIFASEEVERTYRIQEFRLRKILIKILQLVKGTQDYIKIETCNEDVLAESVYEVIKSRSSTKCGNLSIADIDRALSQIVDQADNQFTVLYQKCSAVNLKWLVKIILKNMKLKIPDKMILDCYHPFANALFERYHHLSKVCEYIESGEAERAVKEIKPFLPVRAMLAQKLTSDINKHFLSNNEMYAETKMDGERFQLHYEEGIYKYYSRKSHDYSEGFNKLITPLIKFKTVVHSLVLDGEMLIWNKKKCRFITKGENVNIDVKRINYEGESYRPCFCPFDVLYFNGTCYMNRAYSDRVKILENLIEEEEGVIMRVKPIKVRDSDHLTELINEAMNNQEEGLILKKSQSVYKPGERNAGWYKLKPDYLDDDVVKDFDCVIIGGTFHNEHSRDYIGKYTLGAIKKNDDGTFDAFSIGEAVHGVSVTKRMELSQTLIAMSTDYDGKDVIQFEKGKVYFGGKSRPHIFIPPHKSRILEIRASELAQSSDFYTKYSFRFPRIQSIRTDKIWDETMTLDEFEDLYKNADGQVVKITLRSVHNDDIVSPSRKKFKGKSSFKEALAKYCGKNQHDEVKAIDRALTGIEFCVMGTAKNLPSIQELIVLLKLHNASITSFPRVNKTFAIVAGDLRSYNVKNYTKKSDPKENHNILKAEWIVKNLQPDIKLPGIPKFIPQDFLFIAEKLKTKFVKKYDKFGDSYKEKIGSTDELMEIINEISDNEISPTVEEIIIFERELHNANFKNPNIFRGMTGIFVYPDTKITFLKIAEQCFKFRGGRVVNEEKSATVFVDQKYYIKKCDQKTVSYKWILDSSEAGKKLNLEGYKI